MCRFLPSISAILQAAAADGFDLVIDGTHASDDAGDRPGMRALRELSVRSPLRECGLTKAEIRARSREGRFSAFSVCRRISGDFSLHSGSPVLYYLGNRSDGCSMRTGWRMLVASHRRL